MLCCTGQSAARYKASGFFARFKPSRILSDRGGVFYHSKALTRRFVRKGHAYGWTYVGSHNFSPSAWGSGSYIGSYELGILLIVPPPSTSPSASSTSSSSSSALVPLEAESSQCIHPLQYHHPYLHHTSYTIERPSSMSVSIGGVMVPFWQRFAIPMLPPSNNLDAFPLPFDIQSSFESLTYGSNDRAYSSDDMKAWHHALERQGIEEEMTSYLQIEQQMENEAVQHWTTHRSPVQTRVRTPTRSSSSSSSNSNGVATIAITFPIAIDETSSNHGQSGLSSSRAHRVIDLSLHETVATQDAIQLIEDRELSAAIHESILISTPIVSRPPVRPTFPIATPITSSSSSSLLSSTPASNHKRERPSLSTTPFDHKMNINNYDNDDDVVVLDDLISTRKRSRHSYTGNRGIISSCSSSSSGNSSNGNDSSRRYSYTNTNNISNDTMINSLASPPPTTSLPLPSSAKDTSVIDLTISPVRSFPKTLAAAPPEVVPHVPSATIEAVGNNNNDERLCWLIAADFHDDEPNVKGEPFIRKLTSINEMSTSTSSSTSLLSPHSSMVILGRHDLHGLTTSQLAVRVSRHHAKLCVDHNDNLTLQAMGLNPVYVRHAHDQVIKPLVCV
jgi:hypothetical protein